MNNPLISVIVPIYNVEKYLPKCIESIINQTYKNLEIILVDDGSPDNCGKICDDYANLDDRIKVIHQENKGVSIARNIGLEVFSGEYISFVDGDDYLDVEFIDKLFININNTKYDMIICQSNCVDENNKILCDNFINEIENESINKFEAFQLLIQGNILLISPCLKLIKRNIIEGIRFPIGIRHEDELFAHYLINKCDNILFIKEKLYFYVINENSLMQTYNPQKYIYLLVVFYDRFIFFKKKKYYDFLPQTLNLLYGNLIGALQTLDYKIYKKEINKWTNIVFRLYFPKIRSFKILYFYIKTIVNKW